MSCRVSKIRGFAGMVVLVVMLIVAVSLPIAVKLVQQNQENRSSAASESIKQDKKCKDVGGVCQKKSGACSGTYLNNYCPSTGSSVKCCVPAKDTTKCLDVGGRCQFTSKTVSCTGTTVKSLCSSKTNGSSVVCCVAENSNSPCTALGGTCVDSTAKTAGGSCTSSDNQSGYLDLNRSCKTDGKVCCFPSSFDTNGKCVDYSKKTLTSLPEALCLSGTASWDGGDMVGSDGKLNWKCKGFSDGTTVSCSAKFKSVKDTAKCLNVGGRCQEKSTACAGGNFRTDKTDLCSGSNASGVGCCVVTGSTSPCTAMKGTCIDSASETTSGGSCTASNGSGVFDLTFSCGKNSLCCFSTSTEIDGKCIEYSNVLTSAPEKLCSSGTATWSWAATNIGVEDENDSTVMLGDKDGTDGGFNWKCVGIGGGADDECTAKRKVDAKCNSEYSGDDKSATSRPGDALACSVGKVGSKDTKNGYYTWKCNGLNGGKDVSCKIKRNTCGAGGGTCVENKAKCVSLGGKGSDDSADFCGKQFCCKLAEPTGVVPTSVVPTGITPTGVSDIEPTEINLDKNSMTLKVGEWQTIGFTIVPANSTNTAVTWASSNDGIATVTSSGLIKAISNGTANITVKTANNKTDTVVVTVVPTDSTIGVTGITLTITDLTLQVGERQAIGVTVVPSTATDKTVSWTTSNGSVATVSSSGLVVGVSAGNAVITATAVNGKSATVNVSVGAGVTAISTAIPTSAPTGELISDPKISFKFSFRGIAPQSSSCFDSLSDLKVEVMNISSRKYESGMDAGFEVLAGETTPVGDQIFKVTNLSLDSDKFSNANEFNYVKIKGPFHAQARMCQNGQTGKVSDTTVCSIKLDGSTVYDFSRYALLSGDINQDGMINGVDYSELKSNFGEEVSCGDSGDLNMDGAVNSVDANLLKDALSTRDDE